MTATTGRCGEPPPKPGPAAPRAGPGPALQPPPPGDPKPAKGARKLRGSRADPGDPGPGPFSIPRTPMLASGERDPRLSSPLGSSLSPFPCRSPPVFPPGPGGAWILGRRWLPSSVWGGSEVLRPRARGEGGGLRAAPR
jgi:hypothetical protein